ncbi:MAG: hypothetical protein ACLUR5_04380 [Eubacterium ventriosum]
MSKVQAMNLLMMRHEADIIVINSCCFIKDAKEESIETIFEMARYKEEATV